jgi:hypothetical protein
MMSGINIVELEELTEDAKRIVKFIKENFPESFPHSAHYRKDYYLESAEEYLLGLSNRLAIARLRKKKREKKNEDNFRRSERRRKNNSS